LSGTSAGYQRALGWLLQRGLQSYLIVVTLSVLLVVGQYEIAAYPLAAYVAFCVAEAVWNGSAGLLRAFRRLREGTLAAGHEKPNLEGSAS
jgi:hypothetical protein